MQHDKVCVYVLKENYVSMLTFSSVCGLIIVPKENIFSWVYLGMQCCSLGGSTQSNESGKPMCVRVHTSPALLCSEDKGQKKLLYSPISLKSSKDICA